VSLTASPAVLQPAQRRHPPAGPASLQPPHQDPGLGGGAGGEFGRKHGGTEHKERKHVCCIAHHPCHKCCFLTSHVKYKGHTWRVAACMCWFVCKKHMSRSTRRVLLHRPHLSALLPAVLHRSGGTGRVPGPCLTGWWPSGLTTSAQPAWDDRHKRVQ
jgi:hypothetical protein